jgi:hypothetical protein
MTFRKQHISHKKKPQSLNQNEAQSLIQNTLSRIKNFFSKNRIEEIAKSTCFVERNSKITGFNFLVSLLVSNLNATHATLERMRDILANINHRARVTAQSFMERLNSAEAVEFLQGVLERLLEEKLAKFASTIPAALLEPFEKVLIQDSTVLELNEKLQEHFKGSGGRASHSCAKVDVIYDLKAKEYEQMILTDQSETDQELSLKLENVISPGTLIIRDLGYLRIDSLKYIVNASGFFLSRLRSDLNIYLNADDECPIDFVEHLSKYYPNRNVIDLDAYITAARTPIRLVAYRAPQEVVDKRKRQAHATAKKQGRILREKTLRMMEWTILITNVSRDIWSAEVVGTIYRIRWQIELLFKSWKSGLKIDYLKGINPNRVKCLIYSRLMLVVLINEIYKLAEFFGRDIEREVSMHKIFIWVQDASRLIKIIRGRLNWWEERLFTDTVLKSMCKQKRKKCKSTLTMIQERVSFGILTS